MDGKNKNSAYTSDTKMLLLIDVLKTYDTIKYDIEFCDAIGLLKQNLVNIRKEKNHFTPEQIEKAIKAYKVDANWIFGISDQIFMGNKKGHTTLKNNKILNKTD